MNSVNYEVYQIQTKAIAATKPPKANWAFPVAIGMAALVGFVDVAWAVLPEVVVAVAASVDVAVVAEGDAPVEAEPSREVVAVIWTGWNPP